MVQAPAKTAVFKAVIFDFDGVIAAPAFRQSLQYLASQQGLDAENLPREALRALKDSGHMVGKGSAEAFWTLLQERTPLRGAYQELHTQLVARSVPRPAMLALSDRLREAGYVTAVLSDHTPTLDEIEQRNGFFHRYDQVFNSYYLGLGKIDPAVFGEVARRLGVKANEAIFTDDNPGNVRRARSQGLHAFDFFDVGRLERDLASLLVFQ